MSEPDEPSRSPPLDYRRPWTGGAQATHPYAELAMWATLYAILCAWLGVQALAPSYAGRWPVALV